jgi:hypothetical protein
MAGKLSKEQWASLRKKAEAGESDASLEAEFGILANAIRQKRFADKRRGDPWITPKEIDLEHAKKALERHFKGLTNAGKKGDVGEELAPVSSAELASIREDTPAKLAKWASGMLLASLGLIRPPTNVTELKTLSNFFRENAGLNQQGGGINIAIGSGMNWSSQGQAEKPIVVIAQRPESAPA